ncbi:LysM peptidoglycan-binding domain-containing protein [Neptunicella marina]|uniref:LysM peptidoglycan-binding domain-containing protein n=2 Tax=Neptunicella marina TaxID=2125989 RepID=A0A8J6IRC4_9ALTE|nr:LysM peptidoglycan-binding domain-containing protein [Neptunicella marina]MBC3764477.1 LysM peptidoglycan-binding domain-containing protein [Neptunicella marina]
MKRLLSLPLLLVLNGCATTSIWNDITEQQQTEEHLIANKIVQKCEQGDTSDIDSQDCEQAHSGVIPVNHPSEEVDIELQANQAVIEEAIEEPVEITDVWERVRDQLHFAIPDNRRVANQRNWYLEHPTYMQRVTKRATPFLYMIVDEIEKRDMPLELALLPIVESAFDPFAYSHGRAAGMWQFIPATGKRFGLKQGWWYDGRRDVVAATQGALDYLTYLYKMFDGNWLHALAAYNSGEGRVLRAVKHNRKKGKSTDFWHLDLPRETRAYVPKLLALADILKNTDKREDYWYPIANQPVTEVVDIGSQIDLALAAELAEMPVKELHALNPGYNRWATDPDGPHRLLLPVEKVGAFSQKLAETADDKRLNWVRHKVRSGDSLLKLAHKYHTTVDIIRDINKIKGNVIVAGDHLLVPVALKSLDSYALSQDQRIEKLQSRPHGANKLTHYVVSGDTFWDLSRKYKVSMRNLAKWNGMAPTDPLMPGKELVIWVNKVSANQTDNSIMRTLTYTVRNGDSLARIAKRFKVLVSDITKWNQLNVKKYLQPGQKLKIFVDVTRT